MELGCIQKYFLEKNHNKIAVDPSR